MVTYRSILRMGEHTLPKQCLKQLAGSNILIDNILKKLGSGKPTPESNSRKIKLCKALNTVKPTMKMRWKQQVKKVEKREYDLWIAEMLTKLQKDVTVRINMTPEKHLISLGSGTAYLMSLNTLKTGQISLSHIDSFLLAKLKVRIRRLKAGLIPFMRVLRYMYEPKWYKMSVENKKKALACPCGTGIQDVKHTVSQCHLTCHLHLLLKTAVEARLQKMLAANRITHEHCATLTSIPEQDVLQTALHLRAPTSPTQLLITEAYARAAADYLENVATVLAEEK